MKKPKKHPRLSPTSYAYRQMPLIYLRYRRVRIRLWLRIIFHKRKNTIHTYYLTKKGRRHYLYATKSRWVYAAYYVCILSVISIAFQLAYPHNKTMPFSRLEAQGYVGLKSPDKIAQKFQDFDSRLVTIHTHTKTLTTSYTDLGVRPQVDQTFEELSHYPTRLRLIPFSILVVGNKRYPLKRILNESQLQLYARDIIAEANQQPRNASLSIKESSLIVMPATDGYEYQNNYLKAQVLKSSLQNNSSIVFAPTVLRPNITTETVTEAARRMQRRINNAMTITAENHNTIVDSANIASWVEINPKPENKKIELTFNKAKVANTLRPFTAMVDEPSTPTIVTLLNGLEAGRTVGTPQKVLQLDELVDKVVNNAAFPLVVNIPATVNIIPPKESIVRRYSRDSTGIQNLFDYWTQNHKGQYSLDLHSQNGKITANINPYRTSSSTGIYRLFVAHTIYGRITARSLSGGTFTSMGYNVDSCMDEMVRNSNEACSAALGDIVGWSANDDMLHAQGFANTSLLRGAGFTTASDTSTWLIRLLDGSITTPLQATTLINMMKVQTIRTGIPAGSKGIPVASKAGAYGGLVNDVAIVYHPRGTYVFSVLSSGGSFQEIADLTSQVNSVFNE